MAAFSCGLFLGMVFNFKCGFMMKDILTTLSGLIFALATVELAHIAPREYGPYILSIFPIIGIIYCAIICFHKPSGDAWLLDREWRMFFRYKGFNYANDETKLEREFSKWLKRRKVIRCFPFRWPSN